MPLPRLCELRMQPALEARPQQLDPLSGTTELDERIGFRERGVAAIDRHRPLPLAHQHEGLRDAGDDAGVEAAAPARTRRPTRRADRNTGRPAPGPRRARARRPSGCTRSSSRATASRARPGVDFDVRVEVVRQRQVGIDVEGALERLLAEREILVSVRTGRRTCRSADSSVPASPTPARTADRARRSADRDRARRPTASSRAESGWRADTGRRPRGWPARHG